MSEGSGRQFGLTEAGSEAGYREMEKMLTQQLEVAERINQRAVTLSEFDLAIAGIVAAGFKIADLQSGLVPNNVLVWMVFGIGAFIVSIYICMTVYTPKKFYRGTSPDEKNLHSIFSIGEERMAWAALAESYARCFRENNPILSDRVRRFEWAISSAYLGVVFVLGAVVRPAFPPAPPLYEVILVLVLTGSAFLLQYIVSPRPNTGQRDELI